MAWIERWLSADLPGERALQLTDSGGIPVTVTLATTAVLTDALAALQTQANLSGDLAGTYTFSLDAEGAGVTLACDETFTVVFVDNMGKALGFSGTKSGAASYSSDVTAHAFADLDLEFDAPDVAESTKIQEWRHGRHGAAAHAYSLTLDVTYWLTKTAYDTVQDGPLFDALVRLHCSSDGSPYTAANLDGYIDFAPFGAGELQTHGSGEDWVSLVRKGAIG